MAKGLAGRMRFATAAFTMFGAGLAGVPAVAVAQISVGVAAESPSDALARNMKILGTSPKSFEALIAAGRASLSLGDTQSAAGFFGRAEEVWPQSPLAQAGMGAALAQEGDGNGALQYFARAQQRGATQSMIGCDRGLAYDLLGRHSDAQKDYRAALFGSDADEARRRLALSLAITGNKADALSTLSPLMARGDAAGARTRAFVLALTGDSNGAKSAMEAAMPGSGTHMAYFFQKLPGLRSDQKAAAVNLGIFPNTGVQMASASPPPVTMNAVKVIYKRTPPAPPPPPAEPEDRMESIQEWLSQATRPGADQAAAVADPPQAPQQVASASVPTISAEQVRTPASTTSTRKLWIQLASGPNATSLPSEFDKMKRRNRDLFEGISGYIAEEPGRARLLIGPFRNDQEANIFADDLASVHIDAFTWTNQPGQAIRKLTSE